MGTGALFAEVNWAFRACGSDRRPAIRPDPGEPDQRPRHAFVRITSNVRELDSASALREGGPAMRPTFALYDEDEEDWPGAGGRLQASTRGQYTLEGLQP